MKLKTKTLEEMINLSLIELRHGFHDSERYCIHIEDGMKVIVEITKDDEDFDDVGVAPLYRDADE